jgi:tetratricopeptide (TPR) repeat protein
LEESLNKAANAVETRRRLSKKISSLDGQTGLAKEKDKLNALISKGDRALSQHRMETAIEEYQQADLGFKDLMEEQMKQANNAFKAQHYEKALEYVNRAITMDPAVVDHFKLRGAIFAFQKKFDLALLDYNKVVEQDPHNAMSYYGRGIIALRLKKYRQSIDDFDKSITIHPENANAFIYRGIAHKLMKNYHSACLDFAEACALGSCSELESSKKEGICPADK